MSSNVVDFAAHLAKIRTSQHIEKLLEVGFSETDISILTMAANRAFSNAGAIPSSEEASERGLDGIADLTRLQILQRDDASGKAFALGTPAMPKALTYVLAHDTMTFEWNEPTAKGYDLCDHQDAGVFITQTVINHLQQRESVEQISLLGFFALDALYFACQSPYHPLHLQIFPGLNIAGLILFDSDRQIDVVLIAQMDDWVCTPEDAAQVPKAPPST